MTTATKIEIRTPDPVSSHGRSWCKTVTSVSATAKTGHDWQGEFVTCDRLVDADLGDLFLGCCFRGSRKNGNKVATLHVVCGDGLLVPVETADSDEWAIQLRTTARALLALDGVGRAVEALRMAISDLEGQGEPARPLLQRGIEEAQAAGLIWMKEWGCAVVDSEIPCYDESKRPEFAAHRREENAQDLARCRRTHDDLVSAYRVKLAAYRTALEALSTTPSQERERPEVAAARAALAALTAEEIDRLFSEVRS